MLKRFHRVTTLAAAAAFLVIVLGAWVRLSNAGLGCPDWPGCYGQLTWPGHHTEIAVANQAFPERPVEVHKAWKEMVHRYLAGTLVLLVLAINWLAWRGGPEVRRFRLVAGMLAAMIVFQALLGMWTVTLKLLPAVVMAHLLGGMTTLALLTWASAGSRAAAPDSTTPRKGGPGRWVTVGLIVLVAQIALGGWTSANYAALACPDLPQCTGQWWPDTDFGEAFVLWREVGVDYEGGILDQPARAAIHISHRIGALVTFMVLLLVGLRLRRSPGFRGAGALLIALVSLQFLLGLLNVFLKLPLPNAVAHNAGAALLLATLVWTLTGTRAARKA